VNQHDSVPFEIRRKAITELLDFVRNYFLCREKGDKPGQKKKENKTRHKIAHHIF
jgi:hypothetical protein